ncbi:MAG: hypothetical protein DRQ51_00215 [Gammaproteobacteria bacterium]|nr:MAG: hypothetical protein DRQ51_00215 [Gammaproteobacteria bacterium]
MNKTNIDSMLIEMITPKLKEIEERFVRGEGLKQEDINTLLLKSQYNHINHLDQKLDEVTSDVASLKDEFTGLKDEFTGLKGEFALLKSDIKTIIQQALNKNMVMLIAMIGFFLTLSKALDLIIK